MSFVHIFGANINFRLSEWWAFKSYSRQTSFIPNSNENPIKHRTEIISINQCWGSLKTFDPCPNWPEYAPVAKNMLEKRWGIWKCELLNIVITNKNQSQREQNPDHVFDWKILFKARNIFLQAKNRRGTFYSETKPLPK